jgi:UDP-N-acetyl-D-glucosamine dehydrogenase
MQLIEDNGGKVAYSDPYVPEFPNMRDHNFNLKSVVIDKKSLQSFDAVLLATDHDDFDFELIQSYARLIIDCRGRFSAKNEKIVRA